MFENQEKNTVPIDVLILGMGPTGIGILRSLRQYDDLAIFGAVMDRRAEKGQFSKFCTMLYWPDPKLDAIGFQKKFLDWAALREKVVVFATRDDEVYWLAANSNVLPSNILYYRNPLQSILRLMDKNKSVHLVKSCGIKTPDSYKIGKRQLKIPNSFRYPGIIKPINLPFDRFPHKNMVVYNIKEIETVLKDYPSLNGSAIFQEYVIGGDEQVYQCTFLVGHDGDVLGSIEFRKMRQYPVGRGIASFGYTIPLPELPRLGAVLAKRSNVKGLFSIEFKRDHRNNQWTFIEANLRMPGYNSVFSKTDVSLARVYIYDLLNEYSGTLRLENRKKVYWMREELDLANVLKGDVSTGYFAWLKDLKKTDVFTFWDFKDYLPGTVNFIEFITNIFKKLSNKKGDR